MKTSDLIFVGIKGSVVSLNRTTGQQVWATHLKGSDFVSVVLENDMLLAVCHGEVFCLDPLSGNGRWHNPLKGLGTGLATVATGNNPSDGGFSAMAEKRRRDEESSAAAASAASA
jgi:outer membrane protein assembly factor BamB